MQIITLFSSFDHVSCTHVLRAYNSPTNALASFGASELGGSFDSPPDWLKPLYLGDVKLIDHGVSCS